jgi:CheY-like chemotaxis protein
VERDASGGMREVFMLDPRPPVCFHSGAPGDKHMADPTQSQSQSRTKKRILIVEDDPGVLELFSVVLRTGGYEVLEAEHSFGAICAMVRAGADLVLTDINMPVVDGLGLVRELKAHADTRHVPVVAITGDHSPEKRAAALEAGCAGYLTKPLNATSC